MIRFLCVILLLSLPTQAFAELGFDKMGGYLRVGDILFRIPKTQKISSSEPWPERPDPQKPEPVDTGDPDIATGFGFYGVDAASFAGSYVAEKSWGSSWIKVRVQQSHPLFPRDDWCAMAPTEDNPLTYTGRALFSRPPDSREEGFLVYNMRSKLDTTLISDHNATFFGAPITVRRYREPDPKQPARIRYTTEIALSRQTRVIVSFYDQDLQGTSIDTVMHNIDKAIRSWIVPAPFSPKRLAHEGTDFCYDAKTK